MMLIAQLSDPHLTGIPDNEACLALQNAVSFLMALPNLPDVVLITGDVTDHGTPAEYQQLQDILKPLTMPIFMVRAITITAL